MMKKPRRKTFAIYLVAILALAAGLALVAKTRLTGQRDTAMAADSTADSTAVASGAKSDKSDKHEKKKKGKKDKNPKNARIPVEVATVASRSISSYYQTTATLEAEKRVDILAKIAGEVKDIAAEEGDHVKEGQLLCRLDDDELKVALDKARINRDKQKVELDRVEAMHGQNLISDKEYLDTRYAYELAQNDYQSAQVKYDYSQIRAPFSGVVLTRSVDRGATVAIGAKLYTMADTHPLLLSMYLPEAEARRVRPGQPVYIRPDTDPDTEFDGEILRVAPEVDLRTGTVKVTAQTVGAGVPGSFVRVKILMDTHKGVLAVPRRSVLADAGDHFVFVAAADSVRKVGVGVGYEDETHAEITRGLSLGDSVVTAGTGGIREGSKIKVVPPPDVAANSEKKVSDRKDAAAGPR